MRWTRPEGRHEPAAAGARALAATSSARRSRAARRRRAQGRALAPLVRQFDLPRSAFEALIEGVEMDLGSPPLRDVRRSVRVLHPGGVGGRPDLPRDLRLRRPAVAAVRDRSRRRAAADEHPARRPRGSARGAASTSRSRISARTAVTEDGSRARESRTPGSGVRSPQSRRCCGSRRRGRATTTRAPRQACRARDARRLVAAEIMGAIYRGILDRIEARRLRRVQPRRPHPAAAARADCGGDVGPNGRRSAMTDPSRDPAARLTSSSSAAASPA